MCDVCIANAALKTGHSAYGYRIEARGEGPEWNPCEYRIWVEAFGTPPNHWEETDDLAGLVHNIGFDMNILCWSEITLSNLQNELRKFQ